MFDYFLCDCPRVHTFTIAHREAGKNWLEGHFFQIKVAIF